MLFKIGELALFQKSLFSLKMYVRVFRYHVDNRLKNFFTVLVLHSVKKGIDSGHNSPMLLVNNGYSQIVFRQPHNKEIVFW